MLLVGVSIKLVLHDPTAVDQHFSDAQRLQLGVACTACFGMQMIMGRLHTGLKCAATWNRICSEWSQQRRRHVGRYYYRLSTLLENPSRTFLLLCRLALNIAMTLVALPSLPPYVLLCVEAALALLQCVLIYVQEHMLSSADVHQYVAEKSKRGPTLAGSEGDNRTGHETAQSGQHTPSHHRSDRNAHSLNNPQL